MKNSILCLQTTILSVLFSTVLFACTSSPKVPIGSEGDTVAAVAAPPESPPAETSVIAQSFRGKTTFDLNDLSVYNCGGGLLSALKGGDSYAISTYAAQEADCQNGACKIVLEKQLGNTPDGKANFVVLDELDVQYDVPRKSYARQEVSLSGKKEYCLMEYADNSKSTLDQVFRLWKIDRVQGRFVPAEVPPNQAIANPFYMDGEEDMD